ncbi:MAG TPA: flagellar biosynthetic protein FliO [Armatimonadota bacterium]|nr:flagellar biosynthetic protein FliO [Armatimonadota bacterium]
MTRVKLIITGACLIFVIACCTASAQTPGSTVEVIRQEHVVQKGELAIEIAKKYNLDLEELKQLNSGRNIAKLQIGDRLVVGVRTVEPKPENPAVKTAPEQTTGLVKPPSKQKRPDKVVMMTGQVTSTEKPSEKSTSTVGSAFWMIIKLGLVLGLAYATILALKLLSERRDSSLHTGHGLKVVDTVRLSNTSSLHLVDVGGKTLLLGCSSGQVNLLKEIEPESAEMEKPAPAEAGKFSEYLEKYSSGSFQNTPAGRIAGLLRDCVQHLQSRKSRLVKAGAADPGNQDEA